MTPLKENGREMNLPKEEITKKCTDPVDGEWFDVNPLSIDQSLFSEERKDEQQERTREMICWAFCLLNKYPEKYGKPFQTMVPEKDWLEPKLAGELYWMARRKGVQMGWELEQVFEWAQRISDDDKNWDKLCNHSDKSKWPRIILKHPYDFHQYILVGSGYETNKCYVPTKLVRGFRPSDPVSAVPFMVRYENS